MYQISKFLILEISFVSLDPVSNFKHNASEMMKLDQSLST